MTRLALDASTLSAFPHASLNALRAALVRDTGAGFATILQESGFAGGAAIFEAFRRWCIAGGKPEPEQMPYRQFQQLAAAFFEEAGWGTLTMEPLSDVAVALDSPNWSESDPAAQMPYPSCYWSAGMLADFFGRVAEGGLGALEVECRSTGAPRCRFLVGSGEVLGQLYTRLTEGVAYEDALRELAT